MFLHLDSRDLINVFKGKPIATDELRSVLIERNTKLIFGGNDSGSCRAGRSQRIAAETQHASLASLPLYTTAQRDYA